MFYYLSKIIFALLNPMFLGVCLLCLGVIWRGRRGGLVCLLVGIGAIVGLGFLPVGTNLLVYLEKQYPMPDPLPDQISGIIVLGGAVESGLSHQYQQTQFNDYAERFTEMLLLSRHYPQAKVVYSGGEGGLIPTGGIESDEVRKLMDRLGIPTKNFVFEGKSRTTYENMTYSRDLIHPQPVDKWLLVTSAHHLPRAVAVFKSGGWNVVPYPAGYQTTGEYVYSPSLDFSGNVYKFQIALKEIIGIIAYTHTGRIHSDVLSSYSHRPDFGGVVLHAGFFSGLGA
jgi:uncharacterized SAM-binding protein YcdF (DUF218 family)